MLAWFRLGDLGSLDPGSNPGDPTTLIFLFEENGQRIRRAYIDPLFHTLRIVTQTKNPIATQNSKDLAPIC